MAPIKPRAARRWMGSVTPGAPAVTPPAAPVGAALELVNVTAGYGRHTVLRDVNLVVRPGSIVALVGTNGAGKTTLLRAAAGLLRPSRGAVRIAGEDVTAWHADERTRRGLCLIPEGRGIYRSLSVAENLRLFRPPWISTDHVDSALQALPALKSKLGHQAGTLSGGQQQMLALARMFLAEPRVVMFDEVSMGLAPLVVDEIFEAIGRFAKLGSSLLVVEQFVERALDMADHVYLLSRGSVAFSGSPAELDRDQLAVGYLGRPSAPS
jgi:branched-chain amino acid transport system ATP-binding protein